MTHPSILFITLKANVEDVHIVHIWVKIAQLKKSASLLIRLESNSAL